MKLFINVGKIKPNVLTMREMGFHTLFVRISFRVGPHSTVGPHSHAAWRYFAQWLTNKDPGSGGSKTLKGGVLLCSNEGLLSTVRIGGGAPSGRKLCETPLSCTLTVQTRYSNIYERFSLKCISNFIGDFSQAHTRMHVQVLIWDPDQPESFDN